MTESNFHYHNCNNADFMREENMCCTYAAPEFVGLSD
jgi:hypothetical protein